jgi:hypothetical protein
MMRARRIDLELTKTTRETLLRQGDEIRYEPRRSPAPRNPHKQRVRMEVTPEIREQIQRNLAAQAPANTPEGNGIFSSLTERVNKILGPTRGRKPPSFRSWRSKKVKTIPRKKKIHQMVCLG